MLWAARKVVARAEMLAVKMDSTKAGKKGDVWAVRTDESSDASWADGWADKLAVEMEAMKVTRKVL